jgi:hypothetical protein
MDGAQISNLAGGPPPAISRSLASGPESQELLEAKKRLIATLPELEIRLTHWKQKDFSISNRNKNGIFQPAVFLTSQITRHTSLACPPKSAVADEVRVTGHFSYA